jgi:hypothetical protein
MTNCGDNQMRREYCSACFIIYVAVVTINTKYVISDYKVQQMLGHHNTTFISEDHYFLEE